MGVSFFKYKLESRSCLFGTTSPGGPFFPLSSPLWVDRVFFPCNTLKVLQPLVPGDLAVLPSFFVCRPIYIYIYIHTWRWKWFPPKKVGLEENRWLLQGRNSDFAKLQTSIKNKIWLYQRTPVSKFVKLLDTQGERVPFNNGPVGDFLENYFYHDWSTGAPT